MKIKKLFLISLGCDKNRADSEEMLAILMDGGYSITAYESEADVILINSCCFIGDAMEESIQTIIEMGRYKTEGKCKVLAVAGCLAQRYREDIRSELPEVDVLIGTTAYEKVADVLDESLQLTISGINSNKCEIYENLDYLPKDSFDRVLTTGGIYAYLKIAEGCNKCCTYCVIPQIRGKYRSIPMENIISQAKSYAALGVRELVLVAQESTLYGTDIYGEKSLHILLGKLSDIEEIYWIRIMYAYPEEIYPELVEAMARLPKVCNYLDMPIQHANDKILRLMGRRTTRTELFDKIKALKEAIPGITLRTTLITGFPTESEKQHLELMEFIREVRFDRLGVFEYSRQEGTKAFCMDGQVDDDTKHRRYNEIMSLQQEIAFENAQAAVQSEIDVLIEGYLYDDGVYIGRTYRDAPDIDGYVFVNSPCELIAGSLVRVRITGADNYDLIGDIVYESAK